MFLKHKRFLKQKMSTTHKISSLCDVYLQYCCLLLVVYTWCPPSPQHVEGEVYEVDQAMLQVLDELEVHPKVYRRTPMQCVPFSASIDPKEMDCETYFLTDFKDYLLELPFHKSFTAYPKDFSHGHFVPRNYRENSEVYVSQVKNMDS